MHNLDWVVEVNKGSYHHTFSHIESDMAKSTNSLLRRSQVWVTLGFIDGQWEISNTKNEVFSSSRVKRIKFKFEIRKSKSDYFNNNMIRTSTYRIKIQSGWNLTSQWQFLPAKIAIEVFSTIKRFEIKYRVFCNNVK